MLLLRGVVVWQFFIEAQTPSLRGAAQPVAAPDTLIENLVVAGLGFESSLRLLGTLFHPRAGELRSVMWQDSSLIKRNRYGNSYNDTDWYRI